MGRIANELINRGFYQSPNTEAFYDRPEISVFEAIDQLRYTKYKVIDMAKDEDDYSMYDTYAVAAVDNNLGVSAEILRIMKKLEPVELSREELEYWSNI